MVLCCPACKFTANLSDPGLLNPDTPPSCPRCHTVLIQPEPNVHSALVARRYEPAAQPMSEFPWEERSSWLDLLAFWRTTLEILFSPSKAFSSLNYDGGVRSSLVYALVYGSLGHIVGRYWLTLAGIQYGILEADPLGNSLRFAVTSLFAPILLLIYVLVSASLIHLFLLLLGGSHRPLPERSRS